MSWLEIALIALALIATGMGGHAVGFGKGMKQRRWNTMVALHDAWNRGFEAADRFFNDESFAHFNESNDNPYPLPHKIKEKNQ